MKDFVVFIALATLCRGNRIKLYNNCPFTVWPGILGNPGKGQPDGGGFALGSHEARDIQVPRTWAGRIWPRTQCDGSGHCKTGDCGNRIQCNGAGGVPPVSLAEITFAGHGGLDYYDISLVDGYNLPVRMEPISGFRRSGGKYDCTAAGCHRDLNAICPRALAVKDNGRTIACMSACMRFNTDQYCCRGAYGTPQTCKSSHWPVNYPADFKKACPDAYSYAYDDTTSTFTCQSSPAVVYQIVFCP